MSSGGQSSKKNPEVAEQEEVEAAGGAALSTSTSSFEALDPHDPHLNHLAEVTFSKTAQWISGELEATQQDYKLLEQMNKSVLRNLKISTRKIIWQNHGICTFFF